MPVGERLKEERERLRLTQPQITEITGTSKQTQSAYENERTPPKSVFLAKLAAFSFDVGYIITGERLENTATTPMELSYLRICRKLEQAEGGQKAGNAALLGVLASYGLKFNEEK